MSMSILKKCAGTAVLAAGLFLGGCSIIEKPAGKLLRIEFLTAGTGEVLKTLDQQTQEEAFSLLEIDSWEETGEPDEELIPEYTILVYQETTAQLLSFLPFFSNGADYAQILEFTTYRDSPYIYQQIDTGDLVENSLIPSISISTYYKVDDAILEEIYKVIAE